jgi:trk system potassium uptake protein TrkH
MRKKKIRLSTTRMIALGFLILITIGTLLLMLPISSRSREMTPLVDALFTADTSACVTGLVVYNTLGHWSLFGQVIILGLIQVGGLGVVTMITLVLILLGKRLSLYQVLLMQDSLNIDSLRGIVGVTKRVVRFSLTIEGIGALLYMIRFVPMYGPLKGLWYSIFTAVSAFCNAGIDLTGGDSLCGFRGDIFINLVTIGLIVIAGLGFPVWWDMITFFKRIFKEKMSVRHAVRRLTLHSKLVLTMTGILVFVGALLIFIFDYHNDASLSKLPLWEKILSAFFQAVTVRTAGFQTIPQADFSHPAQLVSMILMFIGGSPCGTAGGVKTVTVAVIILNIYANIKHRKSPEVFRRSINAAYVQKATTVFMVSSVILFVSIISLCIVMPSADIMDVAYELTSAIGTVGLSRGLTAALTTAGKIIVILTMFAGRIGPISLALAFTVHDDTGRHIRELPEEKITVG